MRKLLSIFLISFSLSASIPAISSESQNPAEEDSDQNLMDAIFGTQDSSCRDYPNCLGSEEESMIEDAEMQNAVYSDEEQDNTSNQPE